jgi:protein disulfide-isomerase A6
MSGTSLNEPLLVLFYAPWCGFCKKIKPVWEQLQSGSKNSQVNVVQVNCDKLVGLAILHGVKSYPTIKYLPNGLMSGKGSKKYEGERDLGSLVKYLNKL